MKPASRVIAVVGLLFCGWKATPALSQTLEATESLSDATTPPAIVVGEPPDVPSEETVTEALASGAAQHLASEAQQELLGEWMESTGATGRKVRLFSGSQQLIASSIGMAIGISLFVQTPNSELSQGLGLALVASSGAFMSLGIVQLAKKSQAELRLERWKRASKSRMSLRELGRFEGELRAQAEVADRAVKLSRWSSFGMGVTGGLILGLTPAANLSSDARTASYIVGGIMAGFGFLSFAVSFAGGNDSAYDAYERGQRPLQYSRRTTVRAAPAVGRNFFGAQVVGQF